MGEGSPLGSMLSTVGVELTSSLNSDFSWKKFSKGYRSSTRRARKSVAGSLTASGELVNKDFKIVDMRVTESEKLGVSILGCRFSEKAEHVPIKKRRFLFRSPSPPGSTSSSCHEENGNLQSHCELGLEFHPNLRAGSQLAAIDDTASTNDFGQVVDTKVDGQKILLWGNDKLNENDFSGISILADAACSNSFEVEDARAEEGSGVEESVAREGRFEVSMNNESCSLTKGLPKEDLCSTEISTEGTGSSISAVPAEELVASPRTDNSSRNGLPHGKNVEGASMQDLSGNRGGTVRTHKYSSFDRSHWDLNTVMDAWEHPFDDQHVDCQINAEDVIFEDEEGNCSDRMGSLEGNELQRDPGGIKYDRKILPPSDSNGMSSETQQLKNDEHTLDGCTDTGGLSQVRMILDARSVDLVPSDDALGQLTSTNVVKNASSTGNSESSSSHQVARLDSKADYALLAEPDHYPSTCVFDANCNAASTGVTRMENIDDSATGSKLSEIISSSSQVQKHKIAMLPLVLSGTVTCETGDFTKEVAKGANGSSGMHDDRIPENMFAVETGQPLKSWLRDDVRENYVSKSDEMGLSQYSPQAVEITIPGSLIGAQPAVAEGLNMQRGDVSVHAVSETDSQVQNDGEELKAKCSGNDSDNVTIEGPSDRRYDSKVSHDDLDPGNEKVIVLEVDYDSQYEDGEVRESIIHAWEEYDGEDVDAEHMDYGSDDANNLGSEAELSITNTQDTNFHPCLNGSSMTRVIEAGSGKEKGVKAASRARCTGKDAKDIGTNNNVDNRPAAGSDKVAGDNDIDDRGNHAKKASQSARSNMKMSGWDQLPESRKDSSETMTRVRDCSSRKNINGVSVDGFYAEDSGTRVIGSRPCRKDLGSRIAGRVSQGVPFRRDRLHMPRSSDPDNSNSRFERESGGVESFCRGRNSQRACVRGQGGDHLVDFPERHRSIKCHPSPSYHGLAFRHPWPDASPHVHRHITRSGSPVDRDEVLDTYRVIRAAREFSPDRRVTLGRGTSIRYGLQVDGRLPRVRYNGPVLDGCTDFSLNHSRLSAKRERSFSPIERREDAHAPQYQMKSRSRSRTRSPNGWQSPRRRSRTGFFGHPSSGQRRFLADRMVGFRLMPGRHGSPPHNSRWIGDRKDKTINFTEQGYHHHYSVLDRRSPGKFCPRDDRFDLVDSKRNDRSMHHCRVSEMDGVGRGRPRYEGNADGRRKYGSRYGPVHHVTQPDMGGPVKRFRYNVEDGFGAAHNSRYRDTEDFRGRGSANDYGRGIDRQISAVPVRSREERVSYVSDGRDEKNNGNSKSYGMREGDDEDVASRKEKPK